MLLWSIGGTRTAMAHGSDRLLHRQAVAIGGDSLTVWTSPSRLRPGEVHVDVQIVAADGTLVNDHFVQVRITPLGEQGTAQQTIAQPLPLDDRVVNGRLVNGGVVNGGIVNGVMNQTTHEARFRIDETGTYEVAVDVSDQTAYLGGVNFAIEITPVSPLTKTGLHLMAILSTVATLWFVRMGIWIWFAPAQAGANVSQEVQRELTLTPSNR
jgi:hypothetical protein